MSDYSHPDHGDIETRELNTRIHDGETMLRCERCHVMAKPEDADEAFDDHDCDHYKDIHEGITGELP